MADNQENQRGGTSEQHAEAGRKGGEASHGGKDDSQPNSERGFAAMDDEEQRRIASEGGKAAHASGHAHEFDSEEAREAGKKGGEAVSKDHEHMAEIGRKGGEASHGGGKK